MKSRRSHHLPWSFPPVINYPHGLKLHLIFNFSWLYSQPRVPVVPFSGNFKSLFSHQLFILCSLVLQLPLDKVSRLGSSSLLELFSSSHQLFEGFFLLSNLFINIKNIRTVSASAPLMWTREIKSLSSPSFLHGCLSENPTGLFSHFYPHHYTGCLSPSVCLWCLLNPYQGCCFLD